MIKQGKSSQDLLDTGHGFYTEDPDNFMGAVGLKKDYILETYKKAGLEIQEPIHYGSWCGRGDYLSSHDIIVSVKK